MTIAVSSNNNREVATADQVKALAVTPAIETLAALKAPAIGQDIAQEVQFQLSTHTVANDQKQIGLQDVLTAEMLGTLHNKVTSLVEAIVAQNAAPTAATTKDAVAGAAIEKEEKEETQSRVARSIDALADFLEAFSKGKIDPNKDKDDRKIKKTQTAA